MACMPLACEVPLLAPVLLFPAGAFSLSASVGCLIIKAANFAKLPRLLRRP